MITRMINAIGKDDQKEGQGEEKPYLWMIARDVASENLRKERCTEEKFAESLGVE